MSLSQSGPQFTQVKLLGNLFVFYVLFVWGEKRSDWRREVKVDRSYLQIRVASLVWLGSKRGVEVSVEG